MTCMYILVSDRLEKNRLGTFNGRWPTDSHVRPHDLAKAGFYYFGVADVVRCVFCQISLKAWEPGDVPMEEHRKHSPTCPFIQQQNVGNVPLQNIQQQSPSETFPLEWRNVSFYMVFFGFNVVIIVRETANFISIFPFLAWLEWLKNGML